MSPIAGSTSTISVGDPRWAAQYSASSLITSSIHARGVLDYHRTFQIPGKIAAKLGQLHVVVHGEDLNGDGAYSDFMEASLPVACGVIDPA